jgi:hypothetical protein
MNYLREILVIFIVIGSLCVYRTWDRMNNASLIADWRTPSNWYSDAPCKTLAEAIPGAYVDAKGAIQLPRGIFFLDMPTCEFSGHEIFGWGPQQTIIKQTHP